MKKHVNIPIYIPHEGCKNACVFCDQRTITGNKLCANRDIRPEIEKALLTIKPDTEVEIAFFGGSFTGIDKQQMTYLCDTAYEYVKLGKVSSIRLSTRPDYIDPGILEILKQRGVTDIELGLQSMSQKVLDASKRGHTTEDSENACRLIKEYGFNLTGQMMIGLPSSRIEDEIFTAKRICELNCDCARIYPTVVFYNTELYSMSQSGEYTCLSVDEAITRSTSVYEIFKANSVDVLRIGLQSSEELSDNTKVYAGANHPSLGELVIGEYRYKLLTHRLNNIKNTLFNPKESVCLYIFCSNGEISKFCGQNKKNKIRLLENLKDYGVTDIKFKESELIQGENTLFCTELIQNYRTRRKHNCI